ncbi:AraC family transcriptional regulator [Pedobacter duraquae]|uniref:AraC family transcriptional regulator n=1 Tax=Pedobacter duraquae TaxID=425511 RepID=A0A4V3C365_9SPHI|nr:helix-turn-helix transcriptional regulator [Pedobacter duraquae]TDO20819.1 AraC family transcriptional regulator [Pedobacter duraquae]
MTLPEKEPEAKGQVSIKSNHIPVNTMPSGTREGIMIARTVCDGLPNAIEVERPHRDNGHLFILQEEGTTHIEIDFEEHHIAPSSIIYINPDQIHRLISFENATNTNWIITSENLNQENLNLLESITPVNALSLTPETQALIAETSSLCIRFSARKHEKLYNAILKESCNTLVSLVISQYLAKNTTTDNATRFEVITKSFKILLQRDFATVKSPSKYAERLNISTPYLNECVRATTGKSVSLHIQHRTILEAKRLLFHSNRSVKQIAGELGYSDYSYFTRLFTKITAMTPLAFRNKIFD